MRIAILSAVNIRHMSLISLYTEILKKYDIEYDVIYMDKYNEEEPFECHKKYRFVNVIDQKWPSIIKMFKYMLYVPYAEKVLKKNNYDFVIVWNDVAIFMFSDFLRRHFAGKYCFNVRDNMYYQNKLLNWRYKKAFKKAAFVTISSKGYLDILPKGIDYLQIQSINLSLLEGIHRHTGLRKEGKPIRIGFIGYVRYFDRNKKLLDAFKDDNRFELHYYGTNAHILKEYAETNKIHNAIFHDTFPLSETSNYLQKIDIINNLYGNDDINVQRAISIKLFHAIYSRVPILICPNTYVGETAIKLKMGFEIDDDDITEALPDQVYEWYSSINYDEMVRKGNEYLQGAIKDNQLFEKVFSEYLKD